MSWQAATLILFSEPLLAHAHVVFRLVAKSGNYCGTLPTGIDVVVIIERAMPKK